MSEQDSTWRFKAIISTWLVCSIISMHASIMPDNNVYVWRSVCENRDIPNERIESLHCNMYNAEIGYEDFSALQWLCVIKNTRPELLPCISSYGGYSWRVASEILESVRSTSSLYKALCKSLCDAAQNGCIRDMHEATLSHLIEIDNIALVKTRLTQVCNVNWAYHQTELARALRYFRYVRSLSMLEVLSELLGVDGSRIGDELYESMSSSTCKKRMYREAVVVYAGTTPLHELCYADCSDEQRIAYARYLIHHGACPHDHNSSRMTPIEWYMHIHELDRETPFTRYLSCMSACYDACESKTAPPSYACDSEEYAWMKDFLHAIEHDEDFLDAY